MPALSTTDLLCFGRRALEPLGTKFLGVFPADKVPTTSLTVYKDPIAFIANSVPATEPGTHWIAFFKEPGQPLEVFDSYGLSLVEYPSLAHLKIIHDSLENTHSYQSLTSSVCGNYSLCYLHLRSSGFSRSHVPFHFTSPNMVPDQVVVGIS